MCVIHKNQGFFYFGGDDGKLRYTRYCEYVRLHTAICGVFLWHITNISQMRLNSGYNCHLVRLIHMTVCLGHLFKGITYQIGYNGEVCTEVNKHRYE